MRRQRPDELAALLGPGPRNVQFAPVAGLLQTIADPAPSAIAASIAASDRVPDPALLHALTRVVRAVPTEPAWRRRLRVAGATASAKVLIAAGVILGGTVAAAATGNLPGPLQRTVSHALSNVGIDVPSGSSPATAGASGTNAAVVTSLPLVATTQPPHPRGHLGPRGLGAQNGRRDHGTSASGHKHESPKNGHSSSGHGPGRGTGSHGGGTGGGTGSGTGGHGTSTGTGPGHSGTNGNHTRAHGTGTQSHGPGHGQAEGQEPGGTTAHSNGRPTPHNTPGAPGHTKGTHGTKPGKTGKSH